MTDEEVDKLIARIRQEADRTLRAEMLGGIYALKHAGTDAQKKKATAFLEELAKDPDPVISGMAKSDLVRPMTEEDIFGKPAQE